MSRDGEGTAFNEWYNGMVGFHINSERILDDLQPRLKWTGYEVDPSRLEKWMKVCWNNAIDAAYSALDSPDFFEGQAFLDSLKTPS